MEETGIPENENTRSTERRCHFRVAKNFSTPRTFGACASEISFDQRKQERNGWTGRDEAGKMEQDGL